MLRFDKEELIRRLQNLFFPARVALACACAERLFPVYRWFSERSHHGDSGRIEGILDIVWTGLSARNGAAPDLPALKTEVLSLDMPEEAGKPWMAHHAASDCVAALYYALSCWLSHRPEDAAWAASRVYDALDGLVIHRDQLDMNAPGARDRVVGDPLIQAEFQRQRDDLESLDHATEPEFPALVVELRDRARRAGLELGAAFIELPPCSIN
jgi:uncharacterized protein YjaG (DUF416 family)